MIKKFIRIVPIILSCGLFIALMSGYVSDKSPLISYEYFENVRLQVEDDFKSNNFTSINVSHPTEYTKITSYPSTQWNSENNNSYKGDTLKPRQIDFYYLNNQNKNAISKVTLFYAPDSIEKDYIRVDYFDSLKYTNNVQENYRSLSMVPHFEVAFKGKGYYIYVQTTYLQPYYNENSITDVENLGLISLNAELVRQLQNFLISNNL